MNYDVLDESIARNQALNNWFIPFAITLFLALPLSFLLPSNVMTIVVVLSFVIGIVGSYFDGKPVVDTKKVIGEVQINEESIGIKYGQTILVENIKSIKIENDGYEGKTSSLGTDMYSTGIAEFEITDNANEVMTIRFIVKDATAFNYLKSIVRTYYIRKISIKETIRHKTKALLLEPLKTYAENQALKKELGL